MTVRLSGAEAVAEVLQRGEVRRVFGYPGTSELALCAAVADRAEIAFVNARGDREAVFMAGGGSLIRPGAAAAILHGARGSTNACGAIADLRRNEVGCLLLVGQPSTPSARFLPPHGERALISSLGKFAKAAFEVAPGHGARDDEAARGFVATLVEALALARRVPQGPTVVGIPQDALEARWVAEEILDESSFAESPAVTPNLDDALRLLQRSRRCVILVDDYLLKDREAIGRLDDLAALLGAPVFQIRYLRGPMLFERLSRTQVSWFAGWYDPRESAHREVVDGADLLVTIEDRNMYPRVVGALPACAKLAITSDAAKTRKNGYLQDGDLLIEAPVSRVLRDLIALLRADSVSVHDVPGRLGEAGGRRSDEALPPPAELARRTIGAELARLFREVPQPVLVDDGQMLGGLLAEEYDRFPASLRVFGDHGGFVGAGIAIATGLAIQEPRATVVCTLGDQSFTNGLQGLVAAGGQRAPVLFLLCNNGESVSLHKQLTALVASASEAPEWLRNAPNLDYTALARACGFETACVDLRPELGDERVEEGARELRSYVEAAVASRRPHLVELRLPPLGDTWSGIWINEGFDEAVRLRAAPAR
jgi:acetolactate synthase I/II/III large subunit